MSSIEIPNFLFQIGSHISCKDGDKTVFEVYDIVYSLAEGGQWLYKYKYFEGGYEHFCSLPVSYAEQKFVLAKHRRII